MPNPSMRRLLLAVLPLCAGCYTYATIEPAAAVPGTSVRARISGAAAEKLVPILGSADARLVSGELIENGPASMIVEVPTVVTTGVGTSVETLHQRVSIARTDLIELEMRQVDRLRTGALLSGAALIIGSAAYKTLKDNGSGERTPGGTGTDIRIPLFRFTP